MASPTPLPEPLEELRLRLRDRERFFFFFLWPLHGTFNHSPNPPPDKKKELGCVALNIK